MVSGRTMCLKLTRSWGPSCPKEDKILNTDKQKVLRDLLQCTNGTQINVHFQIEIYVTSVLSFYRP